MINSCTIVGRLTRDPELRYLPDGTPNCQFTLAVNRPFKQNGEQQADFISVVVWRKQAENAANYLNKGSLTGIVGRIQTRNYQNNEGKTVYVTEVVADSVQFLEPRNSNGNTNQGNQSSNQSNRTQQSQNKPQSPFENDPFGDSRPIDISSDDLPF